MGNSLTSYTIQTLYSHNSTNTRTSKNQFSQTCKSIFIMKFLAASLISIAALASTAMATSMTLSGCAIGHISDGNQFTMQWNNVPSGSQSSLCGHFADAVGALAGQIVVKSISCSTDNANNMDTIVKLDKTSCVNQANLIGQAMSQALGSGGTLSYDSGRCNFGSSGC